MFSKSKNQRASGTTNTEILTIIGNGYKIEGNIIGGSGALRVEGEVLGDLIVDSEVILGKDAVVTGDIQSNNIIVYGKVIGNIRGKVVELKSSSSVSGNVKSEKVDIEAGADVNGKLETNMDAKPIAEDLGLAKPQKTVVEREKVPVEVQ